MKKKLIVLLVMSLAILCVACGGNNTSSSTTSEATQEVQTDTSNDISEENAADIEETDDIGEETQIYSLGEMISTNIMEYTLDNAEYTIALVNSLNDPYIYFTPKEYDASKDGKNPFVASVGHTLVYFEITVTNLDRNSISVGGSIDGIAHFATVIIDDTKYSNDIKIGSKSSDGINWEKNDTTNVLVSPSETMYIRCYMDVPIDIEDLPDDFDIEFTLWDSSDEHKTFDYHVTEEAINEQASREISLDTAIARFLKTEGLDYFSNHLDEFPVLSGEEISAIVTSKKSWDVGEKNSNGSTWSGKFAFEDDGRIKETIYDGSTGYFNDRTWKVDGDNIILTTTTSKGTTTDICEVRKVKDGIYLFTLEEVPYIITQ